MPSAPSYAADVYPILKKNCRDSCHNDAEKALYKDFSMDHYDQVYKWCTTTPGGSYSTPWLLGNIKHLTPGYVAMPQGAAKLSDCDIAIIEAWINQGAPNN